MKPCRTPLFTFPRIPPRRLLPGVFFKIAMIFVLRGAMLPLASASVGAELQNYNVTWTSPSPDSTGSMPLGNGDIGLNVWTDPNGNVLFYIGKTDAWGRTRNEADLAKPQMNLLKLGRVRLALSPAPAIVDGVFRQELDLAKAEIRITLGTVAEPIRVRLWVDAHHPVIHIQIDSPVALGVRASVESWRLDPVQQGQIDTFLANETNAVVWSHHTPADPSDPDIPGRTFGAELVGAGLVNADNATLVSRESRKSWQIDVHPLTVVGEPVENWRKQLTRQIAATQGVTLPAAQQAHREWWQAFWARSWIFVEGPGAQNVTQGYILQRFISACAGRGNYPVKFNGSIFTSDYPRTFQTEGRAIDQPANADYRRWGGAYWFQNTRPIYWPMLAAGDFDSMAPFFAHYRRVLLRNEERIRRYYGHGGSYVPEFSNYWGYLGKVLPEDAPSHTRHYYFPVLELTALALDYYDYTRDPSFLRETLLPIATLGLQFYDEHFPRDARGWLLLFPVNAAETFWKAKNPTPDLAGLRFVLPRLLQLDTAEIPAAERTRWEKLLREIPELPVTSKGGQGVLLPAEEFGEVKNSENPELYAIYPFRLFGVGLPNLQLARASFAARRVKQAYGWHPDAILAAAVGDAEAARAATISMFKNQDALLRFPAFWGQPNTHDYWPDQDNGSNGMQALQRMLLQATGDKIQLLPAWPKDWNVHFKLRAPQETSIEGTFENGKLSEVIVTPASRRRDVVSILGQPATLP